METIKLDLIPGKKMPSLHASQFDDGREHGIDLFENGVVYKLDGTETLTINERKGDDCICSLDIENTFADSNHIVFASTEQMCAVWGNNICELVIKRGSVTLGTLNFILEIEPSPTEGGIESESEIKNLTRQVTDIVNEVVPEIIGENYYDKEQSDEKFATKIAVDPLVIDNAQTTTLLGSNSITANTDNLSDNTIIELTNAPRFIKKNHGVTARVKFDSFTSLTVGKGYQKYRGKWIVIDATNITAHFFENSDLVQTPIAHSLTISDYLQISLFVDADGVCRISINTTSGTFTTSIDFGYEWNYEPFLFGGQIMTDAKLNYSCDDLKCPLWVFGDSYMGFGANRVAGQLKELHFINYCINAIAGARSVDTTEPNKSSFEDLQKMLEVATPKFIIWADGMNGGDALNIEFLPALIALCEEKGIELILYMPPSTPTISHTALNNYIISTGKRYVNGNDAVGATSEGVWYEGYLSNDNTHPTELGAKALALRFLNDAPELLQYGWNYDVKSDLDAKLNKANPVGTGAISFNRRAGTTIGNNAVAVGFNNTSSGDASFAEGGQNKATGAYSHAENYSTEASGGQSHAEGRYTVASGLRSHAEGDSTTANGSFSHSQNRGTIANRMSQTVFGEYNIAETGGTGIRGNFVEIVGNGTNDNNRSNARTLDWEGNEWLAGDLNFSGNKSLENELSNRYTQTEVDNIVSDAIYNVLPDDTASGSVANFTTSLELPIKSLGIDVNAVQEAGTPTPASPLPISGWSEVNIVRCGKNLLDNDDFFNIQSWKPNLVTVGEFPTDYSNRGYKLPTKVGETYTISFGIDENDIPLYVYLCKTNGITSTRVTYITTGSSLLNRTYTFTSDGSLYYLRSGSMIDQSAFEAQIGKIAFVKLELGSTATEYEPYVGNEYIIELGGTYYGGHFTQDKDGHRQFEITHGIKLFGDILFNRSNNGGAWQSYLFYAQITDKPNGGVLKCSNYEYVVQATSTMQNEKIISADSSKYIYVRDDAYTTVADFKTANANTQLVYPLATPIIIDLPDGEPIITINGTNNIYADTGDTSVVFKCSVNDYVSAHSGGNLLGLGGVYLGGAKSGSGEEETDEGEDTEKVKLDETKVEVKEIGDDSNIKKLGGE